MLPGDFMLVDSQGPLHSHRDPGAVTTVTRRPPTLWWEPEIKRGLRGLSSTKLCPSSHSPGLRPL